METMKISGKDYPVLEYITTRATGCVPLVDLHQMSDERFRELAVKSNVAYFTAAMGRPPVDTQEATNYVKALLRGVVA